MVLIQDHRFIPKSTMFHTSHHHSPFKTTSSPPQIKPKRFPNSPKGYLYAQKILSSFKPINPTSQTPLQLEPSPPISLDFQENLRTHLGFWLSIGLISFSSPSIASEITESSSDKINVEVIINTIADFLRANPFFVSGVTFIYLLVIPLTKAYFRKYKNISAIDAYTKLRDAPETQLLDIRKENSVKYMASPNLKFLKKDAVWIEFEEGKEDNFLKKVLESFDEPANTVLCILDNFDENSLKVAELLYKNGFKEAYAIKGGVRGKDGWLATQQKCFPPSVHMFRRKKKNAMSSQLQINGNATSNDVSTTNDDLTLDSSGGTSKEQLNNRLL